MLLKLGEIQKDGRLSGQEAENILSRRSELEDLSAMELHYRCFWGGFRT